MKTWNDIQLAALNDPLLHQAVTLVESGQMTREEALIAAALALVEAKQKLHDYAVEILRNSIQSVPVIPHK